MKNRSIYIWLIVILLVTNLATIGSILYHLYSEQNNEPAQKVEMPNEQRTRFLTDQLNLTEEQTNQFRTLNRNFNRTANPITRELEDLRLRMLQEMAKENPDTSGLQDIAENIGDLHKDLKSATIDFYMGMKQVCTKEQQTKLYQIFYSMLNQEEDVRLPRGRHQGSGRGRNMDNH